MTKLERENLRLRTALDAKGTLIVAAQHKIEQTRVRLRNVLELAATAMSQAACALAQGQRDPQTTSCGETTSLSLASACVSALPLCCVNLASPPQERAPRSTSTPSSPT